ncbi:uncharacterized protein (TIGR00297 family) [Oikeobacillus pervagus]|uniref:Uncharacterized protein (TIGR00297 family) n=1 Tax=Oikeobacillus pervagus TaxID=1325931 RepID=A0AAJ1WFF2_9BACI|nr:DUF92 domain-containing protein [Oikeobacillus pervagus]MDQ0213872.1 uncharacterized protein (TIGR00297 family) [Oikeobacillus pervagus]
MNDIFFISLIITVSLIGVFSKNLNTSGGIAAIFIGSLLYFSMEWEGLIILGAFFFSSSLWSRFKAHKKGEIERILVKTSRRDWQQVVANGGAAALFGIIYLYSSTEIWLYAAIASIAAANSDTWASEIGTLSKKKPLSIRTFHLTERGESGAISILGTIAGLFGSFFIASIAFLFIPDIDFDLFWFIGLAGFLGNILDTLLGAFVQIEFHCPKCKRNVENPVHCSVKTRRIKGFPMFQNESVNFLSSFFAGIVIIFMEICL